jgi:hypothetical protein
MECSYIFVGTYLFLGVCNGCFIKKVGNIIQSNAIDKELFYVSRTLLTKQTCYDES